MDRQIYFGDWAEGALYGTPGLTGVEKDFAIDPLPVDTDILFAIYHGPHGYSGEAFVIGRSCGVLFFVEGGHCSCFGLEGQWKPDPITPGTLRHMNEAGTQFNYLPEDARAALSALIEELG